MPPKHYSLDFSFLILGCIFSYLRLVWGFQTHHLSPKTQPVFQVHLNERKQNNLAVLLFTLADFQGEFFERESIYLARVSAPDLWPHFCGFSASGG